MNKRLQNYRPVLDKHVPGDVPVIILMDNISMYQGTERHQRLFKSASPKMRNFTVGGTIIPNCSGVKELLNNRESFQHPQKDLSTLKANDLFIGAYHCIFLMQLLVLQYWQ